MRETTLVQVVFVHQAVMNAFVPPASRDWFAYEWREGDLIKHFAGGVLCFAFLFFNKVFGFILGPFGFAWPFSLFSLFALV